MGRKVCGLICIYLMCVIYDSFLLFLPVIYLFITVQNVLLYTGAIESYNMTILSCSFPDRFKGIIHQKMAIESFTQSNPVYHSLFCET